MEYEWDEGKRLENLAKHKGVDFFAMVDFDWDTAILDPSVRNDEQRTVALGFIGTRLFHVVFVERGNRKRIISLRKANRRELRRYAAA